MMVKKIKEAKRKKKKNEGERDSDEIKKGSLRQTIGGGGV